MERQVRGTRYFTFHEMATGGGSLPDLSPESRAAVVNKIMRYSESMIHEKEGESDRTLGIVEIQLYERDANGTNLGPPVQIYFSPTFNPLAPIYYNPGQVPGG